MRFRKKPKRSAPIETDTPAFNIAEPLVRLHDGESIRCPRCGVVRTLERQQLIDRRHQIIGLRQNLRLEIRMITDPHIHSRHAFHRRIER